MSGALSNGLISLSDNPVLFAKQVLLFFGHVTIFSFLLALIPAKLIEIIQYEISRRKKDKDAYRAVIEPRTNSIWLDTLLNVAFVIAVALSIPLFGDKAIETSGIMGLVILLVTEIFDINTLFFKETLEFLELKTELSGKIVANLYVEGKLKNKFTLTGKWLSEINQLLDNGWEVFEASNLDTLPMAILRRSFSSDRFSKRKESKKTPKHEQAKPNKQRKDK